MAYKDIKKSLTLIFLSLVILLTLVSCSKEVSKQEDLMVNTVLGPVPVKDLGVTLMHEHIIWDRNGTEEGRKELYTVDDVVEVVLPYLQALKDAGCQTLVEATPPGAGRDLDVLKACAEKSGLNIITNTGAFDSGYSLIPSDIEGKSADEIASIWIKECTEGIDGTSIKPGFIKISIPDRGSVSVEQENYLRAALKTGLETGLSVQCHNVRPSMMPDILKIIEDESFPLENFIWVHADMVYDNQTMIDMAKKGMWIELDNLGRIPNFKWHVETLQKLIDAEVVDKVLISHDSGTYYVDQTKDGNGFIPYDRIFKEFIPLCKEAGIEQEVIDQIFVENPARVLTIE